MTNLVYIIDTNILVAGLHVGQEKIKIVNIITAMRNGAINYLLSPELFDEYREVLLRPKVKRLHGLSEVELDVVLAQLADNSIWCEPSSINKPIAPDLGDKHLWDLLALEPAAVLVTSDLLLIKKPYPQRLVVLPDDVRVQV